MRKVLPSWIWKGVSDVAGSEGVGSIIFFFSGGELRVWVREDSKSSSVEVSGSASGEVVLLLMVVKG